MKSALLLLTLASAGCGGPYRLAQSGERVDQGLYTVDPQVPWNMSAGRSWQDWTVDGFPLHGMTFVNGLKDGQALYPRLERKENPPVFRSTMSPQDVGAFFAASLELMGMRKLKRSEPAPQPFGSLPGFRMESEYVDQGDLEVRDVAVWTVHEGRLYLIHYWGAKEYYFEKYQNTAEAVIASIRPAR